MNPEELHPIIEQWINSDEFINSLVSATIEFGLESSEPLLNTSYSLLLGEIKPEEFKEKLFAALPEEKRNDELVSRLVNLSLLPVKGPLSESGIDISAICPIDESSAKPYVPAPEEEQEEVGKPADETAVTGEVNAAPETAPAVPQSEMISSLESPAAAPELPSTVTETPSSTSSSPLITPQFSSPAGTSSPFIIHQEKGLEQTSAEKESSPLRPVFYSEEPASQEGSSFANVEFSNTDKRKDVDPTNVVNLKDLPL